MADGRLEIWWPGNGTPGSLLLQSDASEQIGLDYFIRTLGAGLSFGDVEALASTMDAVIGQAVTATGVGNRTVPLYAIVEAEGGVGLADGSEAIAAALAQPGVELRYTPPMPGSPVCCLPILVDADGSLLATIEHVQLPDADLSLDMTEVLLQQRCWQLEITCGPYILSQEATVVNLGPSAGPEVSSVVTIVGTGLAAVALQVTHPSQGLGKVLTYTAPVDPTAVGYAPPIHGYMTSSTTALAGGSTPANSFARTTWRAANGWTATIPAENLKPGTYAVLANLYNDGAAQTVIPSITVTNRVNGHARDITITTDASADLAANTDALCSIGVIDIDRVDATDPTTVDVLLALASMPNVYIDQVFLISQDTWAAMVEADCHTGTPNFGAVHSALWSTASERADTEDQVKVGLSTAPASQIHPGADLAQGEPSYLPAGDARIYAAASGITNGLLVQVSYRAAHLTYASA